MECAASVGRRSGRQPFAEDLDRELRLLRRKVAAGATFVQSQMVFDVPRLDALLERAEDILAGVRFYASVALLRSDRMAERARALPGVSIPDLAMAEICRGGGIELARQFAAALAATRQVAALHIFPLGVRVLTYSGRRGRLAWRSVAGRAAAFHEPAREPAACVGRKGAWPPHRGSADALGLAAHHDESEDGHEKGLGAGGFLQGQPPPRGVSRR
jgi:Methylenetetrahydrofolate reductase